MQASGAELGCVRCGFWVCFQHLFSENMKSGRICQKNDEIQPSLLYPRIKFRFSPTIRDENLRDPNQYQYHHEFAPPKVRPGQDRVQVQRRRHRRGEFWSFGGLRRENAGDTARLGTRKLCWMEGVFFLASRSKSRSVTLCWGGRSISADVFNRYVQGWWRYLQALLE